MSRKKFNINSLFSDGVETHEDLKKELIRRSAVLDFLALYQEARKDGAVERVKHIIHAREFMDFKPQYLEFYITRLLGRCLRHYCGAQASIEKERNSFKYRVDLKRSHTHLNQIHDMQKLVQMNWPWYLNRYYGYYYRHENDNMRRYHDNPQLYWRTRGLADPADVDAMYAAWNQFKASVEALEYVQMDGRVVVHYGNPGYIGRNRWYKPYNNPSYHSFEAYRDFKQWMRIATEFVENDRIFATYRILNTHNQEDDAQIEEMLQAHREEEAEFLRRRAREMAARRNRENNIDFPPENEDDLEEVIYEPQEVEEGTTGETLANRLFAVLKKKGLME